MPKRHLYLAVSIVVSGWFTVALAAEAPVSPELKWALSYEMPSYKCKKPKLRQSNQTADQFARFERKSKHYARCVADYQTQAIEDHGRIVAAAEQGVTQAQAEILVEKLRGIESAVIEIGENSVTQLDPKEADRILSIPSRSSI